MRKKNRKNNEINDEVSEVNIEESFRKSEEFLEACSSPHGFYASTTDRANYRRVWGRDGCITGIGALMSGEQNLIDTFRETLNTLSKYQGRQGQIPSNVNPKTKQVSYGMTSGRVDATLWFLIGVGQYYKRTGDEKFINKKLDTLGKIVNLLEAWEFNQKDFIFIPDSGDWADESPRHGYILYDQLLYHQAIKEYINIFRDRDNNIKYWIEKKKRLKKKIETNFWMKKENIDKKYIYHPEMFDNCYKNLEGEQEFWIEDFHHHAIYKRFDAFANILTILLDFSDKSQAEKIFKYISGIIGAGYLVPAFFPIIFPRYRKEWKEMRGSYSFYFKNRPYHAHNGGLWPMLTGFYVGALVNHDRGELARSYLENIGKANSMDLEGNGWGFYEYHHGLKKTPQGTRGLAWNASAAILGIKAFKGDEIFL